MTGVQTCALPISTLALIVAALDANDLPAVRKSAHSLKGASANIRAQALSGAAKNLETHAAGENAAKCREHLQPLQVQYRRACNYLKSTA